MSLLKHTGISLNELQKISDLSGKETEEPFVLPIEVDLELPISKNEQVVICYVAGYVTHSLLGKHVKCQDCESLFISTHELSSAEYDGFEPTEFIKLLTRGKLKSPSNNLFVFCRCCYVLFVTIQSSPSWPDFLKLKSPSTVFKRLILECTRSSQFRNLLNAS